MAIKGNVTLTGGIVINDAYIKIRVGSISEFMTPIYNNEEPPVQIGSEKTFSINYNFEFRKNAETQEPFYTSSDVKANALLSVNLYAQAYCDLALKLDISNEEV